MVGPKTKACTILLILYPSFLTYLILDGPQRLYMQVIALVTTVLMSYITIVLVQDYFWLKSHPVTKNQRKDIHLFKPLVTSSKKQVKGTENV